MPDLDVLDLEERLTRHYADVATAPSLHRRASMGPRLAFAGLVVAVAVGIGFAVSGQNNGDDLIASPDPSEATGQSDTRQALLRMLERTPAGDEVLIEFRDLDVARSDPDTVTIDGNTSYPRALDYGPRLPETLITALTVPEANQQAFGFAFEDVGASLSYDARGGLFVDLMQLNTDVGEALDQAEADPDWDDRVSRRAEGSFDIVDWDVGFEFDTDVVRRDDVRPLGRGGQLAGFDGDILLRTVDGAALQPFLATDAGSETLADNPQLIAAASTLDFTGSLGFTANLIASGMVEQVTDDSDGAQIYNVPTLRLTETSTDNTSRLVLGFLPGTDVDTVFAGIEQLLGPETDISGPDTIDAVLVTTSFGREGELIVIDIVPNELDINPVTHYMLDFFVLNLFLQNPGLLS